MKAFNLLAVGVLAPTTLALQATTTRYYDGQKGACGCGPSSSSSLFPWQLGIAAGVYTAAGSQALYDAGGATWCGAGCGKCYQLTSTGDAPCQSCGAGGAAGQSIIVMVTNLCPNNGNAQWCPNPGGKNQYGYNYHFDIMTQTEIFGDNVVVDFVEVACPDAATSDYAQCFCPSGNAPPIGGSASSIAPPPSSLSSTSTTLVRSTSTSATHAPTTSSGSGGSSSGGRGVAQHWGQCGGIGWTGPTTCVAGTTCQAQNQWYSQCL